MKRASDRTRETRGFVQGIASTRAAVWVFRLYVAGVTSRSAQAIRATRALCDTYFDGRHELEVFDLRTRPELAGELNVVAAPMLVKLRPGPEVRVIGSLSDARVLLRRIGALLPEEDTL